MEKQEQNGTGSGNGPNAAAVPVAAVAQPVQQVNAATPVWQQEQGTLTRIPNTQATNTYVLL